MTDDCCLCADVCRLTTADCAYTSPMRTIVFLLLIAGSAALAAQQAQPAARWWSHVAFLADDRLQGRETGSPGHREAAEYIAKHFKEAGVKPGGARRYFQPGPFPPPQILQA